MIISSPMIVKCMECGEVIKISPEFECVGTTERNMGTEYEMEWIYEDNCPKCNKSIFIKIIAWEYPNFNLNDSEIIAENLEIIQKPRFSFIDM